jgi:hypothetical protein
VNEKEIDEEKWIMKKIARCERQLTNAQWFFLSGFGGVLLGVFILWLGVARATLFTIGRTRFIADPLTFGVWSILFVFMGSVLIVYSIHVKIRIPPELEELRNILNALEANEKSDKPKA